jgi:hypothetical protein
VKNSFAFALLLNIVVGRSVVSVPETAPLSNAEFTPEELIAKDVTPVFAAHISVALKSLAADIEIPVGATLV